MIRTFQMALVCNCSGPAGLGVLSQNVVIKDFFPKLCFFYSILTLWRINKKK